jgi:glycosyltransferase involved in cell wall biosynthesis
MEALGDFARYVIAHYFWWGLSASRRAARQLAEELREDGVKLIHFHGAQYEWEFGKAWRSPAYYAMAAGIPCLATNHLAYPLLAGYTRADRPTWQKIALLPKTWLSQALILSRLKTEVLVSQSDFAMMRRNYFPFAGKLRQIYHSRLAREESGPPQNQRQKVVLCLGTFCERKGQTVLARAFATIAGRHGDWKLHLVGRCETPEYVEEIKEIAATAGLEDRILIFPPVNDPRPLLRETAIVAMPSLIEPLGLSLQEALYLGAACVGSKVGGIPEMIEHGTNGLLTAPGDVSGLAAALDRLMSDLNLRTALAEQARPAIAAKGMLAETMTESYLTLYRAILDGEVPPRGEFKKVR